MTTIQRIPRGSVLPESTVIVSGNCQHAQFDNVVSLRVRLSSWFQFWKKSLDWFYSWNNSETHWLGF